MIPSKCPDCDQRQCLELSFYQKRIESPFSKTISKKVTGTLYCHHTQKEIPPVQWTDEIENYFNTEKTKQKLNPTGIKFTKWFYFIIVVLVIGVALSVGYVTWTSQQYVDQTTKIEKAAIGDKIAVLFSQTEDGRITESGNTWFQIKAIEGDTVFLKRHKDLNNKEGFNFDLSDKNFTGMPLKVSLPLLKQRSLIGFDFPKVQFSGYITEIKTESNE